MLEVTFLNPVLPLLPLRIQPKQNKTGNPKRKAKLNTNQQNQKPPSNVPTNQTSIQDPVLNLWNPNHLPILRSMPWNLPKKEQKTLGPNMSTPVPSSPKTAPETQGRKPRPIPNHPRPSVPRCSYHQSPIHWTDEGSLGL